MERKNLIPITAYINLYYDTKNKVYIAEADIKAGFTLHSNVEHSKYIILKEVKEGE